MKRLGPILAVAALVVALAGCGSKSSTPPDGPAHDPGKAKNETPPPPPPPPPLPGKK